MDKQAKRGPIAPEWVEAYKKFELEYKPVNSEHNRAKKAERAKTKRTGTVETKATSPRLLQSSLQSQSGPTNRRLDNQFVFIEETLKRKPKQPRNSEIPVSMNTMQLQQPDMRFSMMPQPMYLSTLPPEGPILIQTILPPTFCSNCHQETVHGMGKCFTCKANEEMMARCPQCATILTNPSNIPSLLCPHCKSIVVWHQERSNKRTKTSKT